MTSEPTPDETAQAPRSRFHRCDETCRPIPGAPSEDGDATGGGPYLPGSGIEGAW
ncbi:hypothetical protein GCM10010441_29500 [Kitasatospora paracochleata]|uniref:Uncharacterized protein n=1 Tax=Kitasatospora paracochleata TaxID=58354 RepID=A0ABT1J8Y8_9ACTN|nr:hypothetical protein [Kitasatospora paracochleata]MCP2313911.1 hypothetical protein [Kitasatospora paracochleata]